MRARAAVLALVVLAGAAAAFGSDAAPGPSVEHDSVDCIVAGRYPLFSACFAPNDQVARGRLYFQVEGTPS